MVEVEQLKRRYEEYLDFTTALRKRYHAGAGLWGFGAGPKDDSGHMQFYEDVRGLAQAIADASPAPPDAREAVSFMLQAAEAYRDYDLAVGFLAATQGEVLPLIPFLAPEDARELAAWYEAHYPKRRRLPVQNDVCQALRKQSQKK